MEKTAIWIERLLTEVQEFDFKMFPPVGPIDKGEKIVGDCPEIAKPYFSLAQFYLRECKRIKLEEEFLAAETSPQEMSRYRQMDQKHDALMELFWGTVHHELNTWGLSIGVRKDWKIVQTKDKRPQDVIAGILGIGL